MIDAKLDFILAELKLLRQSEDKLVLNTSQLTASVAAESNVITAAAAAINGIPGIVQAAVTKALADAGVDDTAAQAAIDAATAQAQSDTAALQAAVTANTTTSSAPTSGNTSGSANPGTTDAGGTKPQS